MIKEQELISEFQIAYDYHSKRSFDKAEILYKKILKKIPTHYDTLRHLGILYQDQQMFDMAERYYQRAYKANSTHFSIYNNLGTIKFIQLKMDEALDFYKKAFKMNPKFVPVINNLAVFYHRAFCENECMKFAKLALSIEPDNLNAKINFAKAMSINNQHKDSIKIFKEILEIQPNTDNYINLGTAYRDMGEIKKSYICYTKALECDAENISAFFNLSASKLHQPNEASLIEFEKKLKLSKNLYQPDKAGIAFALYNNYNKLKNYEKAGKFLLSGNKLLDKWINTNINDEEKFLDEIKNIYTPDFIKNNSLVRDIQDAESPEPIFILGMPRSGTTLCEQILSSHSEVFGGGELKHIVDISEVGNTAGNDTQMINSYKDKVKKMTPSVLNKKYLDYSKKLKKLTTGHKFVTDKMPHNFVLIGFIKMLFPNAKIIFCKREKMDNCFSLFAHKFIDKSHGYCYSQKILGKYYDLHLKLMDYWLDIFKDQIYILNHEKLVENQEKYSKEIVGYCGLEWEPECLKFYDTKRDVKTASNEQVREPINKKSFAAWKKYEAYLEPLKKSLG